MWWLLSAHFIFDWGLQNRWMAENKSKYLEVLFAHCMIYTGGISIALEYLGLFSLWKILFILIGHFVIDLVSSNLSKEAEPKTQRGVLWVDHLCHFAQLVFIL